VGTDQSVRRVAGLIRGLIRREVQKRKNAKDGESGDIGFELIVTY